MSAAAIARVLQDFEDRDAAQAEPEKAVFSRKSYEDERAKALAEAESRGVRSGLATAREEHEAAQAEMQAEFERRLAAEREAWTRSEGDRIAGELTLAIAELTRTISDRTADLLVPLIGEGLARRATADLAETVRTLLARSQAPLIRISGPQDLLAALRAALGPDALRAEMAVDKEAGLRLVAGDTTIETQLDLWKTRLDKALRGHGDE